MRIVRHAASFYLVPIRADAVAPLRRPLGGQPRRRPARGRRAAGRLAAAAEGTRGGEGDPKGEGGDHAVGRARQLLRCRHQLGDQRFPARSPFGASCAECGLAPAALVTP
jgi:hypothetical protein